MAALVGDVAAVDVMEELRSAEQTVNRLAREIRRELLVHASPTHRMAEPAAAQ